MANATVDHDEIRKWAESKGGKPAAVDRTHKGDDVGIIRLMFPDSSQSEHQSLVEISWDEFFEQFEESGLALLYDDKSLFSKLVGRDTLEKREHGEHGSRHHPDTHHRQNGDSGREAGSRSQGQQKQAASGKDSRGKDSHGDDAGHDEKSHSDSQHKQAAGEKDSRGNDAGRDGRRRSDDQDKQAAGRTDSHRTQAGSDPKGRADKERQGNSQTEHGGSDDLKSREYKDADGNVHHHTRAYMEQHGKE